MNCTFKFNSAINCVDIFEAQSSEKAGHWSPVDGLMFNIRKGTLFPITYAEKKELAKKAMTHWISARLDPFPVEENQAHEEAVADFFHSSRTPENCPQCNEETYRLGGYCCRICEKMGPKNPTRKI